MILKDACAEAVVVPPTLLYERSVRNGAVSQQFNLVGRLAQPWQHQEKADEQEDDHPDRRPRVVEIAIEASPRQLISWCYRPAHQR